jgi:uncharacterized protein YndB with AHSA1/START domain
MDARTENEPDRTKSRTAVERRSDRELVITRIVNGPVRLVFEAWTNPEHFQRWWVPKSMGMNLLSCELDVRIGGTYRLVFGVGPDQTMAFYGRYLEVTPPTRLSWTNDEGGEDGAITTVTFAEQGGGTLVTLHELSAFNEKFEISTPVAGLNATMCAPNTPRPLLRMRPDTVPVWSRKPPSG